MSRITVKLAAQQHLLLAEMAAANGLSVEKYTQDLLSRCLYQFTGRRIAEQVEGPIRNTNCALLLIYVRRDLEYDIIASAPSGKRIATVSGISLSATLCQLGAVMAKRADGPDLPTRRRP